jgi:hypothetical protein
LTDFYEQDELLFLALEEAGGVVAVPTGLPTNGYVAEDGVTNYVAEDGATFYVQEV